MFKLIILHKNNTDMMCQNDGEEAKSISLTKRYIFIEVNLNVFSVVIKFYRIYVTNLVFTFSFYKYKNHFEFPRVVRSPWLKFWKFLGGGGVIKDFLEWKILGGGGLQIKMSSVGGGYGYFLEPHNRKPKHFCSLHVYITIKIFSCRWLVVLKKNTENQRSRKHYG